MEFDDKKVFMKYPIVTERVDLFDVSIVITMTVDIDPMPSLEDAKDAFYKACSCHEVLNSRVVIERSGDAFYVDNDEPSNNISKTDLTVYELINDNERKRFRIEKGEFIRAFLSPDGLVVMMHHLGGDGKSLLYFIETFMKCLDKKRCELVPFRNLTSDDLPSSGKIPFFYDLLTGSWNRKWRREKRVFDFELMDRAYDEFWKDNKTKTVIKKYEGDELKDLLNSAKRAGVSFTSYFITDMIKEDPGKLDIGLAVDGRIDGNRCMGNQAAGISLDYRYDRKRSFEDNCRAVQKRMRKKLGDDRYRYFVLGFMSKLDSTLKDALNLEHAGVFTSPVSARVADILGYGDRVKDISITNLTKADIDLDYGDYRIKKIIFIPPVVSYAKNVFGIVTAGDVMTITRHVFE